MTHQDYRSTQEQEMYEYHKSLDYSNCKDWSVLFSTHNDYLRAIKDMSHYFHKEAQQIWNNRQSYVVMGNINSSKPLHRSLDLMDLRGQYE